MNSKNSFIQKNIRQETRNDKNDQKQSERIDSPDFSAKRKNQSACPIRRKFSFSDDFKQQKTFPTRKEKLQQQIQQKINLLNDLSKKELIQKIFDQKVHYQKIIMYLNHHNEQKKDKINQQKIEIKILKRKLISYDNTCQKSYYEQKSVMSNNSSQNSFNHLKSYGIDQMEIPICDKNLRKLDSIITTDSSQNADLNENIKETNNFYQNFFINLEKDELNSSEINQFQSYVKFQDKLNELQDFNILRNLVDIKDLQIKFNLFSIFFKTMIQENRLVQLQSICGHSFIVQSIDLLWQLFKEVDIHQRDLLLSIYNHLYQLQRNEYSFDENPTQKNDSLQQKPCNQLDMNALGF